MTKRTMGIFFIVSILMDLIGLGLLVGGLVGSTYTTSTTGSSTSAQVTNFGNLPLFVIGVILLSLSAIPFLIAWIGVLINLARFQEWVWFVLMLIFSWITLLVYLFAGPTSPRVPSSMHNICRLSNHNIILNNRRIILNRLIPIPSNHRTIRSNHNSTLDLSQNNPQPPQDYPQ